MKLSFNRAHIAFGHDLVMAAASFWLSLYLRLGDSLAVHWDGPRVALGMAVFAAVAAPVFAAQRLYRGIWRYASVTDLVALTKATTVVILVFLPVMFLFTRLDELPRSVLLINWFVLLALLGGPRFVYRLLKDRRVDLKIERDGVARVPVLLVGAHDAAELFIRATRRADAEYQAVAILSAARHRIGRNIHGVEVLGGTDDLEQVVAQLRTQGKAPQRLIIADDRIDGALVSGLLDRADALGMTLARLPRMTDLKDGLDDKLEVKPIAIEDLLGRPQTVLDRDAMRALVKGRRVLVTGAGGSIGSELVRQISDFGPEHVTLFDACEFNLYAIDMELSERHPALARTPLLGDVRDRARVQRAMADTRPALVFHAAALKHVPMVEANPFEGLLTNAVGTRVVADACRAHGVAVMVQVSTDKAVNPTNVMGASKRIAECYCQALDVLDDRAGTRFVTVRFGNVLGSTGSVVPLFQRQLAAGGPLTVTHPDMTRYFMTVREAVELVLQASSLGVSSATYHGRIFVLDMGEPVRILDLARRIIRLAGLRPGDDVAIAFTGLRPGEKMFEEILHGAEPPMPTELDGILVASPRAVDHAELSAALDQLETDCRAADHGRAFGHIHALVPEYQPTVVEAV